MKVQQRIIDYRALVNNFLQQCHLLRPDLIKNLLHIGRFQAGLKIIQQRVIHMIKRGKETSILPAQFYNPLQVRFELFKIGCLLGLFPGLLSHGCHP